MNTVKFGVFADPQYCDCETTLNRYYKKAADKLKSCIDLYNQNDELEFIVGLGDLVDKDLKSFHKVAEILEHANKKVYLIAGNHDLEVEKHQYQQVYERLGLNENRYYSFSREGWHFLFLDGNDITWHSDDPQILQQARQMTQALKDDGRPNYHEFNGGIGQQQLEWIRNQLEFASQNNLKKIIFCHYPLLPESRYTLWNSYELIDLLEQCGADLWMNGHHHDGNYEKRNGIHYITFKGMVDTEHENSFAEITLSNNEIKINGYGREVTRRINLKSC